MTAAHIALVDDHALMRGALARVLADDPREPSLDVIEIDSLEKLRAWIGAGLDIDLVLVDAGLPELSGISGLARFRSSHPAVPVIVMAETCDAALIARCARAGIAGAIEKSGSAKQIRRAVRAVLAGESWLHVADDALRLRPANA